MSTQNQLMKPEKTIADYIKAMGGEIARAVPKHVTPDRIARIALTAIRANPKLMSCNRDSLLAGIMTGAQLGLELNTPLQHAYLIPYERSYKDNSGQWKKTLDAQFQIGYQGLLDLAYRTGLYEDIYVEEVYERDTFEYELGLKRSIKHKPSELEDRGGLRFIYAVYHLKNGGFDFKVWPAAKIKAHCEKFSQSFDKKGKTLNEKSAWATNFVGMGKKTVLKDLLKCAPKSIEFVNQIEADEKIKSEIASNMLEVPAVIDADEKPLEITENKTFTIGEISKIITPEISKMVKQYKITHETLVDLYNLCQGDGKAVADTIEARFNLSPETKSQPENQETKTESEAK